MKSLTLKDAMFGAAASVPLPWWDALTGVDWALPYYHLVSDAPVSHVGELYGFRSTRDFARDLDFFCRRYRPVTLPEFVAAIQAHGRPPARSLLLTFDDGLREIAEVVAPMLKAKGVSAVFFVNSASVDNRELIFHQKISLLLGQLRGAAPNAALRGRVAQTLRGVGIENTDPCDGLSTVGYAQRGVLDELGALCGCDFDDYLRTRRPYLTSNEIRGLLADGFSFGGHSIDHPFYADLPLEEQLRQTEASVAFLREHFGVQEKAFAFPHSDRGVTEEFFARAFGGGTLDVSFGTGGFAAGAWSGHFQRFSMERALGSARRIVSRHYAKHCWRQFADATAMF